MTLKEFKNAIYELFTGTDERGTHHMRTLDKNYTGGDEWPYSDVHMTSPQMKARVQRVKTVQPFIPGECYLTLKEFTMGSRGGGWGDAGLGYANAPGRATHGGGYNGPMSNSSWANYKKDKRKGFPYDEDDQDVKETAGQPKDWSLGPVKLSKQKAGITKF